MVVLVLGIAVRVVVQLAYQPALLFSDSTGYLYNSQVLSPEPVRPIGYSAFLRPILSVHNLALVAVVQHCLGILLGTGIYVLLSHLGVRRWIAALAAAPVLLDAYQLDIEQYVMSDTLFEALLLLAIALLIWRGRRLGYVEIGSVGVLLAAATITRFDGAVVVVPVVVFALAVRCGWRTKVLSAALLVGSFALPLMLYAHWYDRTNGTFAIEGSDGSFLYGHVAPFADCAALQLPSYEQPLCPSQPVGQRNTVNWYVWDPSSPAKTYTPPTGMARDAVLHDFAMRVIRQQPLGYVKTVIVNFLRGFRPTHATEPDDDVSGSAWLFGPDLPATGVDPSPWVAFYGGAPPHASPALGRLLARYQDVVYAPGTLLGCGALVGLLGGLGVGPARRSALRPPALLLTVVGLAVVIPADGISLFSWRYQLPQLVFVPAAAALGLTALLRGRRSEGSIEW